MMHEQPHHYPPPAPFGMHQAPPPPEKHRLRFADLSRPVQWLLVVPLLVALGAAGVGAYGVSYAMRTHRQVARQAGQIEVLHKNQAHDHYTIGQDGVGISTVYGMVKPFAQYSVECSQFFANGKTGQPATYDMPCKLAGAGGTPNG